MTINNIRIAKTPTPAAAPIMAPGGDLKKMRNEKMCYDWIIAFVVLPTISLEEEEDSELIGGAASVVT
jgi:hypothetical protein